MSLASSGIVSPYEFAGKKVMFDDTTGNDAVLRALLDDAGIQFNNITGVGQDMGTQSLTSGRVDVLSGYITDQPFQFQQQNIPINIISPPNYGFDFYGDLLFTNRTELNQNPGRVKRMLRASLKGWEYALQHPDEIIRIIRDKYNPELSTEQLRYEARETRKLVAPDAVPLGTLEVERLRRIADIYEQLELAPALTDSKLQQFIYQPSLTAILSPSEQAWLEQHPHIRVGIDRDFAPYEWIDDQGNYVGLAAEYLKLLGAELGVSFEIIADKPWHEIIAMAKRDELDMLSCLNMNEERDKYLDFTMPYVSNPIVIVNANRHGYIGSLENLKGKTIAVEKGYFTHEFLQNDYPDITLLTTDTTRQALELVSTGEADAYIGDAAYANYAIKEHDLLNLQFAGQTHLDTAYRIGVVENRPELFSIINKALNNLSKAQRQEIENKWMGLHLTSGISTKTIRQFLLLFVLVLLPVAYWVFRLRQSKTALEKSESQLRAIIDASPIPHALNDGENKIIYLNRAFIHTFGYTLDDIPTLAAWWPQAYPDPAYREKVIQRWQYYLQQKQENGEQLDAIEVDIYCKDRRLRHVLASATEVEHGSTSTQIVILYDISDRKKAEERLKMSGRVFNQAHEGILITDAEGDIVDINPAFSEITGYSREEVIGKNPSILRSDKHSRLFYQEMWNSLHEQGLWQGEIWNRRKNGELYAELLTISALVDEHGETVNYLGLFSDITQSKEQQQALEMMAHYDMLTQLPNRSLFADRFKQAIAHSNRHHSLLAVVFLDLDGFKPVNDRYGHDTGDQLLIEVAQRIKASIRQDDTASRLGGDEFVLLLNDISSIDHCERLIKRIRHSIELPYVLDGDNISLSASLGITLYPLDQADADTLLRHADQAMYQAKLAGRGRHHFFDAMHDQQISQQQNQFRAIQEALRADQLVLYYQPKVNMRTGEVIGLEALLRWQHPEHGLISPGRFLPVIQGAELEIHVGNWVLEHTVRQIESWLNLGIRQEISVNISSHHLQWEGFFDQLDRILGRHPKVPSKLLQLEILESSVLSDINHISSIINTCRSSLGIRIALDDFGTGYSSLTHLRHLPVDVVKIDQSFVQDLIDDPNDFTIIDGVIGLTDAFHHQVIAEGVETLEHGLMLMSMGCDMAQGYIIAKPMPSEDCRDWLASYQPNPTWLAHAAQSLDAEQTIAHMMHLQAKHWLDGVLHNLHTSPDQIRHWPLMNHKKSHFMHWVEQAKKQDLFTAEWLENIRAAFTELYHEANSLRYQYQEGQRDAAAAGINGLLQRYSVIETLLSEFYPD
jgi:diguanylate cyclase (GGDEF)-like protein/PAS domain S-box-containing protein|nr:EAL domain-containing protein [Methylophaga sp.]